MEGGKSAFYGGESIEGRGIRTLWKFEVKNPRICEHALSTWRGQFLSGIQRGLRKLELSLLLHCSWGIFEMDALNVPVMLSKDQIGQSDYVSNYKVFINGPCDPNPKNNLMPE